MIDYRLTYLEKITSNILGEEVTVTVTEFVEPFHSIKTA